MFTEIIHVPSEAGIRDGYGPRRPTYKRYLISVVLTVHVWWEIYKFDKLVDYSSLSYRELYIITRVPQAMLFRSYNFHTLCNDIQYMFLLTYIIQHQINGMKNLKKPILFFVFSTIIISEI